MRHPEFPVVSFLCIPLLLSSLPSHIRARSIATVALIAWMVLLNLIRGINSIIWANNVIVRLKPWCDITTKLLIGFTFAVPLSMLCICRHLENVSSNRQAVISHEDKRRRMRFEAVMCIALPVVFMALHYVVQGHRYDLIEDVGCYPNTYFSIPGVFVVWVPPLVISAISLVYAMAAFKNFLRRRIEFAAILNSSSISPGRYFRLMSLAISEIIWDTGTNIYILYYNTFTGLRPWISWNNVHSNFSRVAVYPLILIPPTFVTQLIVQWWIIPISSIFIVLFFAFGEEAMSDYRAVITWLRRFVLRRDLKTKSPSISILPKYNAHPHSIGVPLAVTSSTESEHKPGLWDGISPISSHVTEHVAFPQDCDLAPTCTPVIDDSVSIAQRGVKQLCYVESRQSTSVLSVDSSLSSSDSSPKATSGCSVGPLPSQIVAPTAAGTHAGSQFSIIIPSTLLPGMAAATSCVPANHRQSISTDLGITVSQAFLPGTDAASQHHDESFFTPMTSSDRPLVTHPLGGIRLTVEKSVC